MVKSLLFVMVALFSNHASAGDCTKIAAKISDPKYSTGAASAEAAKEYEVSAFQELPAPEGLVKYRVIRRSNQPNPSVPVISSIVVLHKKNCRLADDAYRPARGNFNYTSLFGDWEAVECKTLDHSAESRTKADYLLLSPLNFEIRGELASDPNNAVIVFDGTYDLPIQSDGFLRYEVPKVTQVNKGPKTSNSRVCGMGGCSVGFEKYTEAYSTESGFFMEYRDARSGRKPARIWSLELKALENGELEARMFNTSMGVVYNLESWGSERICRLVRK